MKCWKAANAYVRDMVDKSRAGIRMKDGLGEQVTAAGAELIGTEIASEIYNRMQSTSTIYGSATHVQMRGQGAKMGIPWLNDYLATDVDNKLGESPKGVRAYWLDEATNMSANLPQFGNVTTVPMLLRKLAVRVPVTDELLDDRADLAEWLVTAAADAANNAAEQQMLFGTGETVTQGTAGILGVCASAGSGSTAVVSITTASPTQANLVSMFTALNPQAIPGAKWYVTPTMYAFLWDQTYGCISRLGGGLWIFGREVEVCPWLVSTSPILLGNFKGYGVLSKPPTHRISDQVSFLSDQSEFKFILRVAGSPITKINGPNGNDWGWFCASSPLGS